MCWDQICMQTQAKKTIFRNSVDRKVLSAADCSWTQNLKWQTIPSLEHHVFLPVYVLGSVWPELALLVSKTREKLGMLRNLCLTLFTFWIQRTALWLCFQQSQCHPACSCASLQSCTYRVQFSPSVDNRLFLQPWHVNHVNTMRQNAWASKHLPFLYGNMKSVRQRLLHLHLEQKPAYSPIASSNQGLSSAASLTSIPHAMQRVAKLKIRKDYVW